MNLYEKNIKDLREIVNELYSHVSSVGAYSNLATEIERSCSNLTQAESDRVCGPVRRSVRCRPDGIFAPLRRQRLCCAGWRYPAADAEWHDRAECHSGRTDLIFKNILRPYGCFGPLAGRAAPSKRPVLHPRGACHLPECARRAPSGGVYPVCEFVRSAQCCLWPGRSGWPARRYGWAGGFYPACW